MCCRYRRDDSSPATLICWPPMPAHSSSRYPPGDYPVLAAWALVSPEHPRNAAAVLVLGSAPITSWSMSRTEDPPSADREPEPPPAEEGLTAFTGYAVEAGTGALLGQRRACPRRG